jgi:hypothetical protein
MNALSLSMAFLMGLTGSLHCAGMCGPIIWVMPFQFLNGIKKIAGIVLYHVGRISVYALLALILHSFRNLFQPQIQQYVSIVLGALLLLAGLLSFMPAGNLKLRLPWADLSRKYLGKFMSQARLDTLFIAGILNGLLPCGLVYMALSATIALPATVQVISFVYAFGLGTMPMLVSISLLKSRIKFLQVKSVKKMVPVLVFAFGCLFVLRGMNLGIPYLSPKVLVTTTEIHSCCSHKH